MNTQYPTEGGWLVGIARVVITPQEPVRLAGYDHRIGPCEEVLQDIYARAIALQDETGAISVILATDLLGFTREMADTIAAGACERFGLPRERLVLNASHNHSGPVTGDLLHLYFELAEDEKPVIARYTEWLVEELIVLIGSCMQTLVPANLSFSLAFAGFGTNRRHTRDGRRHLPAPVDHDVPVLSVRSPEGDLLAIVFGYACHTTASFGKEMHGDYAGYAQTELEELYPGIVALFVTGCAGDINPMPRFRADSPSIYGHLLAQAVQDALHSGAKPLSGPLGTTYKEIDLRFQPPYSRTELQERLAQCKGTRRRELEFALARWERGETPPTSSPFPIQVWSFGTEFVWIWLTGEPVVDYSLRFKERYGWESTWVSGYCNELLAYIPSQRVLFEGDYEGTVGMLEYGLPSPFHPEIEEDIAATVESSIHELRHQHAHSHNGHALNGHALQPLAQ